MLNRIMCCAVMILCQVNIHGYAQTRADSRGDEASSTNTYLTLAQIRSNLLNNPPVTGDPAIREASLLGLDIILQDDSCRTSPEVIDHYDTMMLKVKNELLAHPSSGTSIWQMYNHGFLVKTPQNVFAFDLIHQYIDYEWTNWGTRLPEEIVDQIEVLFISHMHIDHQDWELADSVTANGGYVVVPDDPTDPWLYPGNTPMAVGETINLCGLQIKAHYALHGDVTTRQYEVLCQNGLKILHTGDNQTSQTLPVINDLDVLLLNGWINESGDTPAVIGMRNAVNKLAPTVMIPGHIMELGHPAPDRGLRYSWALEADDVPLPSDVIVMAWGERYFISGPIPDFFKIKFFVNVSQVPDTIGPGPVSVVQVRGNVAPLTWDGDSQVFLENISGDYWAGEASFPAGKYDIEYKFYTNASHETVFAGAAWEHEGWEADLSTGNRICTMDNADMTLPLQFVNGIENGLPQDYVPWEDQEGSFVVWIRVNMQGWEDFDPSNQIIGVRGSNYVDWRPTGEISWNCTYPLVRESDHANMGSRQYPGGYFYSGPVHVPDQYAGAGIEFKVVVHHTGADLCESWDNMIYDPALQTRLDLSGNDTTIHWFCFNGQCPGPEELEHDDAVIVTWIADMSGAIADNGFSHGEHLEVRSGYYGTANEVRVKTMNRQGLTNIYEATDTVMTTICQHLDYQYYKTIGENDYREIYYNYEYSGEITAEAERRVQDTVYAAAITIEDDVDSETHQHRMPSFRNTNVVARPVTVTFTCDLSPAICFLETNPDGVIHDIQTNVHIGDPDSIAILGVIINGPATGSWGNEGGEWGPHLLEDETKRMHDDGTHGDAAAGDLVFSIQFSYFPDSGHVVGQEFKFGIGGGDNESGWGLNRIENIDDSQPTSTIACQFGSTNPLAFTPWNYDTQTCSAGEPEYGDINGDGGINVIDIVILANHILDISPLEGDKLERCDCNGDGLVNILDAVNIANVILGIIPECPGGGTQVKIYPETIAFLKQLQPYLSSEEFKRFMKMLDQANVPTTFSLSQNYPNPFNPTTTITYSLPVESERLKVKGKSSFNLEPLTLNITLKVFNILGQEVRTLVDRIQEPGYYTVTWDGKDGSGAIAASGIYFYRLTAGSFSAARNMVLMK